MPLLPLILTHAVSLSAHNLLSPANDLLSPSHDPDLSLLDSISRTHDLNLTVSLSGSRSITEAHGVTAAITLTDLPS